MGKELSGRKRENSGTHPSVITRKVDPKETFAYSDFEQRKPTFGERIEGNAPLRVAVRSNWGRLRHDPPRTLLYRPTSGPGGFRSVDNNGVPDGALFITKFVDYSYKKDKHGRHIEDVVKAVVQHLTKKHCSGDQHVGKNPDGRKRIGPALVK